MVVHAISFGLYLLSNVAALIIYVIYKVSPDDTNSYLWVTSSIIIIYIDFISEAFLCNIFWTIGGGQEQQEDDAQPEPNSNGSIAEIRVEEWDEKDDFTRKVYLYLARGVRLSEKTVKQTISSQSSFDKEDLGSNSSLNKDLEEDLEKGLEEALVEQ